MSEPTRSQTMSQEEMLAEIYENTEKAKNYLKWQIIITLALIVIPVLAMLVLIPMLIRSMAGIYGGVIQ